MKSANEYLTAKAVRETTETIFDLTLAEESHFEMELENLSELADQVVDVIKSNYPDLKIPYHSRWGHFRAGHPERLEKLNQKLSAANKEEQARCQLDLVVPSVLLDAGAGPKWSFNESSTGFEVGRSEGLGIASFYMFMEGAFSADSSQPFRSDVEGLKQITSEVVGEAFQVSDSNPLVGLEGRAGLVRSLGEAVAAHPDVFIGGRPGGLVDYFLKSGSNQLAAEKILETLLQTMGSIWPGRLEMDGVNLGDVWEHPTAGKVAFHKLSQWLTYSLLEPFEHAGFTITGLDNLTGLAEYRNGGLFVDGGVLKLKDTPKEKYAPSDPVIVEWRALTVQLLDRLAPFIRERLGLSEEEFPLAKVLEGGTWWTGRKLARERRPDGSPPLKIESDGTVF